MDPPQVALKERAPTVIGVMWMQTFLATVFVWSRIWVRHRMLEARLGWDDGLMVASWFLFLGYSSTLTAAAFWGFGQHMDELSVAQLSKSNLIELVGQSCYVVSIGTSKSSVAVFLLRIVVRTWHKVVLWTCIVTLVGLCIATTILIWVPCKPFAHQWNATIEAECWMDYTPLAIATGSYSAFIDFVLAGLPWAIVWKLQMRKKEKKTIAMSLSLGVFAGMCGIVKSYELQGLSARSDYSYETVSLVIWSASELVITIICANIPLLRPLWTRLRGKVSTHDHSSGHLREYNATIGSARQTPGRSKGPRSWNELEDLGALANLGDQNHGQTKTRVTRETVLEDDARSSDSILRALPAGASGREVGRDGSGGIQVQREYHVNVGGG